MIVGLFTGSVNGQFGTGQEMVGGGGWLVEVGLVIAISGKVGIGSFSATLLFL